MHRAAEEQLHINSHLSLFSATKSHKQTGVCNKDLQQDLRHQLGIDR